MGRRHSCPAARSTARSTAFSGNYADEYVATVEITLAGGKTILIKQGGRFHSIKYTEAVSNYVDIPLEEVPADVTEGDVPEKTPDPSNDETQPEDLKAEDPKNEKRAVHFRS